MQPDSIGGAIDATFHFISSWRVINKCWEEAGAPWVFFPSSCDESGSDVIMK